MGQGEWGGVRGWGVGGAGLTGSSGVGAGRRRPIQNLKAKVARPSAGVGSRLPFSGDGQVAPSVTIDLRTVFVGDVIIAHVTCAFGL